MKLRAEVTKAELKKLVVDHLRAKLGNVKLDEKDVKVEVITKENYRATQWEDGDFRAVVERDV